MNLRDKNRMREHSLELVSERRSPNLPGHLRFRCTDSGCDWIGWLSEDVREAVA